MTTRGYTKNYTELTDAISRLTDANLEGWTDPLQHATDAPFDGNERRTHRCI